MIKMYSLLLSVNIKYKREFTLVVLAGSIVELALIKHVHIIEAFIFGFNDERQNECL